MQEKHELLCQAVKAMELEDEEHKKFVALKEDELQQYQQEVEDLRNQLQVIFYVIAKNCRTFSQYYFN